MEQSQHIYSCACLNVRVHATSVAEQLAPLEDIAGVRQCYLASKAVEVAQGKLLEIKPASSIDRSISVARCLVCKSPVIYFRNPQLSSASSAVLLGQQQAKLPLTGSPVFLDSKTMVSLRVAILPRKPHTLRLLYQQHKRNILNHHLATHYCPYSIT
ncbi:hypothetical protein FBU59_004311 [Linderina macrospora]|uniref:Uncharacterized protein n=1 Tax=Linderina macrospora TaxID=4868 RepID=A0ACC1J651_9FUNG|nr:hypothetical protein FBU59_004311 [Linderina macrospora]